MKTYSIASVATALTGAALFASVKADVDPLVIKGQHFFYKTNGSEFFIRGVAYQQDVNSNGTSSGTSTFTDPLADANGCARDISLLQQLGINTIRVYAIDPTKDHSQCMNMLQAAGIYLFQDLSNPSASINRDSPTWDTTLFATYAAVVDAMAPYSNVIGFFAGNEVSNALDNTVASAFVKAAVRDMKAYIKMKNYRSIGVGYATNDDQSIRENLANYFNCGDQSSAIDFWGYNIYSWCGDSSYTLSGYDRRVAEFSNYSVPAFFAEYGCNTVQPRTFTEVQALYGPNMTGVFSGGIVYMYFQEANDYGLVTISGTVASKLPDYTALSSQLAKIRPSSTAQSAYTVVNTAPQACPTVGSTWAASNKLPPIANPALCDCMVSSLLCVAKSSVTLTGNQTAYLFNYICGEDPSACYGINANGTTGAYGAYSMCSASQKLSFVMNQYYLDKGKGATACDFNGNATTQSASPASSCSALLGAAGASGTGTVTFIPTGAGTISATSSSATASKSSIAVITAVPQFDLGMAQLSVYILVAVITGGGMILL